MATLAPAASFGGLLATDLVEVTNSWERIERGGRWAVVVDYGGAICAARFATWQNRDMRDLAGSWVGPDCSTYSTSLNRTEYVEACGNVRERIAAGDVYQVNVCRVLSADVPDAASSDIFALAALLEKGNPAPFAGVVRLPDQGLSVASASPELFLRRRGSHIQTGPIKGTAATRSGLTSKDEAENVMIVDLMRNDFGRVCVPGSVQVPDLLRVEEHPTLVHLVSVVEGQLREAISWSEIFNATFPAGSITGAPKSTAMKAISELEPIDRGPYCGAIGWIDTDTNEAELAVGIRTFWLSHTGARTRLHFGTGAGITWGSDPELEWNETELKAQHLISVAAGEWSE